MKVSLHFIVTVLSLLILSVKISDQASSCEGAKSTVCNCHTGPGTSFIRCENIDLTETTLYNYANGINSIFDYLVINRTTIQKISKDTFQRISFRRIYIEENNDLTEIDSQAFLKQSAEINITTVLVIRNNSQLSSNLFELTNNFPTLRHIEFDRNRISSIPSNALKSLMYVELIFLNDQNGGLKTIEAYAINYLPKLSQILLENNQLTEIKDNGIILCHSTTADHIYINLRNNSLTEKTLTKATIRSNKELRINLEKNSIKSLTIKDSLLQVIANGGGTIYMSYNPLSCNCDEISKQDWLNSDNIKHMLYGVSQTSCSSASGNQTLEKCLAKNLSTPSPFTVEDTCSATTIPPTTPTPTTITTSTPIPTIQSTIKAITTTIVSTQVTTTTTLASTSVGTTQVPPFICSNNILSKCHCYIDTAETANIICSDITITDSDLIEMTKNMTNQEFSYLTIMNTKITKIQANQFSKATFTGINIANNDALESIDKDSFTNSDKTKVLVIRNNTKLQGNLFDVAKKFQSSLTRIEFDHNRILSISKDDLSDFPELEYVYLNDQTGTGGEAFKSIQSGAIHGLKSLKQLILANNSITDLFNKSIDISDTETHIYIDLKNNNLTQSKLNTYNIYTIQDAAKLNVTIDLDNNQISSITENDLFELFARSNKGIIMMRGNPIECNCTEVQSFDWLKADKVHHLWGLSFTFCDENQQKVALSTCVART